MLKYQEEIAPFSCDLTEFHAWDGECFRWTFETIEDERNFLPIYVLNPQRMESDVKRKKADCKGWALSFFRTQDGARERILHITADKPQLYLKLGTHTAKGSLCSDDGIRDEEDDDKHFNHFENINRDLVSKFEIIEVLHTI